MNEEYVKKALKYWQPYPVAQVRNVVILLSNLQLRSHTPRKSTLLCGDTFCFQEVDALQPGEAQCFFGS